MKKTSKKGAINFDQQQSSHSDDDAEGYNDKGADDNSKKDADKKKGVKQSNTIIEQIRGMSTTPMNDQLATKTIEEHKYLLELVENRAAIAYFAVANRNQSLFLALKSFVQLDQEKLE